MRPDDKDLDEEIRGHLALSVQDRVERGEDPEAARLAALREFGYVPAVRDSMRGVWYSRWFDWAAAFRQDIRIGLRSLGHARGLAATVVITLALGIGANAAVFSVVRDVLLRPLVNRDQDRLIYIRQSAPGIGAGNTTFSVPEIAALKAAATTVSAFGEFSTIEFTMIGFGEPRVVRAGVVNGAFFDVVGLRPVLGRLLGESDDGPDAAGAAVLTHRFWSTSLDRDPNVIGRTIRLGTRDATVIGVLQPSIPYPADTEIIANVVTSPHHLEASMVTERTHRMTELFGRLAPNATLEAARTELAAIHGHMMRGDPEAYPARAGVRLSATRLRDQVTAPARTVLLLLLVAAGVVFIIACSNVANLIVARTVRRQGELAVRAALGASTSALRRTLLAESLVLCGGGAGLGVLLAHPLVSLVSRYASRFSVRALDVTVDATLLWVGAGLAMIAAVVLAYAPRLPSARGPAALGLASGSLRMTPGTNRRLRTFAMIQIAFSFVLLAGAGMLIAALVAVRAADTGYDMRQVLAFDVPPPSLSVVTPQQAKFYQEAMQRLAALPRVEGVAMGNVVPWRDAGAYGADFQFTVEGHTPRHGEGNPHARLRVVTPGFFDVLGVPMLAGRDFTPEDGPEGERVVIVSQSLAERLFPAGNALNGMLWWTDPYFGKPRPRRIVGVVADVDDQNLVRATALAIYHPFRQMGFAGRLFVRATGDPYPLVERVTEIIREMSADQPVERAATLEDVRAEILAPERLNAFVFSAFALIALSIALVGVAGVLAFSVSARTREFGVRLAIGSTPWRLLTQVLSEGAVMIAAGMVAGGTCGYALAHIARGIFHTAPLPGILPLAGAAAVLAAAGTLASAMPAARAARVDVLQALRSE